MLRHLAPQFKFRAILISNFRNFDSIFQISGLSEIPNSLGMWELEKNGGGSKFPIPEKFPTNFVSEVGRKIN